MTENLFPPMIYDSQTPETYRPLLLGVEFLDPNYFPISPDASNGLEIRANGLYAGGGGGSGGWPGLSEDPANVLEVKEAPDQYPGLFLAAELDCTFKMEDILSEDSDNKLELGDDGKLKYDGECSIQVADLVSEDTDNGLGFGSDGKLWFDNTLDCNINIGDLVSTQQDNLIELSLEDGKLFAQVPEAECNINIAGLLSEQADQQLIVSAEDGKIYMAPNDCEYDLVDSISTKAGNKLKLDVEAGGDGKLLVEVKDMISTDSDNALEIGGDGNITLPLDKITNIGEMYNIGNFMLLTGSDRVITVPGTAGDGGQWLLYAFLAHEDADVPMPMFYKIIGRLADSGEIINYSDGTVDFVQAFCWRLK